MICYGFNPFFMNGVSIQQSTTEIKNLSDKSFCQQTNLNCTSSEVPESKTRKFIQELTDHIITLENLVSELNKKVDSYIVPTEQKLFYTRHEVCKLLSVSLPTLNAWEKANILIPIRIGSRVRYSLEGIKKALIQPMN